MPAHPPPKTQSQHGKMPQKASARRSRKRPAFQLEELEPRLLFSADLAPLALLGASTPANDTPHATASLNTPPPVSIQQLVAQPAAAPETTRHELIFVDGGIDHLAQLLADLQQRQPGVQLVVIDPEADGLAVITETLRNTRGLDAMHVLSHGNEHGLQLGGTFLDSATLQARAQEVAGWSSSFRAGADLMLYGCDLAAGFDGQALSTNLGLLTGTDVAASADLTGNARRGGDWSLEYQTGLIQAQAALDGQGLWQGTLGIATAGNETLAHTATGGTSETTTTNKQMAADSSGNFVAVWQNGSAIEGQRFTAAGAASGAKFTISSTGTPANAQVAMNASGAFVVVWNDASDNLYFRRYDSAGVAQGGAVTVLASVQTGPNLNFFGQGQRDTTSGKNASVGINTAGDFVVTYRLNFTREYYALFLPTGQVDVTDSIAFKAYTSAGAAQGTNATGTISTSVLTNTSPAIAMNASGAYVVSWSDANNQVSARLYDATRTAVTLGGDVTSSTAGGQSSVGMSDSGTYVVAYANAGVINYRLYDAAGNAASAVTQANLNPPDTTPAASRANPSVAMTATGEFAVAWENAAQDGSGTGVYLRQYTSAGVAVRSDIQVATSTSGAQHGASLVYKGTQVTALWNGNGTQTGQVDTQGVFFQRYVVTTGLSAPGNITTTAAALAYTENQAATAVDNALSLAPDPDGDYYQSATVSISSGFVSSQDVLAFTNANGITGSFNATTGVMTLTGNASIARYQAALRSITYANTSDDPITATRTVSFVINDGTADSNTATRNVTVTAVNDAPVVTTTAAALAYTENQAATLVDPNLTVSDADGTTLTGATVSIGTGFATGQDVLAFTNQGGITGSYNATTGVLTLSGTATLATYQTALRTVTYVNTSDNPSTTTRTVTFAANDGGAANNIGSGSRNIAMTAVNDAPVVTATASALAYTENQAATAIDPGLTTSDIDSTNFSSATISISANFTLGQDVLSFTNQGGITGSYNSGTGVLTLSGTATVSTYQTALRTVKYANSSDNPSTTTRTVTFTVNDGSASNNTASASRNITVTAVNDAPVLTATAAALPYTENQAATTVDPSLTVTDVDSTSLTGATVTIGTGFASGQDLLAFTDQNGITGSYNSGTGVLTLSGTATVATYQTALRSITYANTSESPSTTTRTVTFTVNDGSASNNTGSASRNITVTAVNDAPVVTTTAAALSYTENQAATAIDTGLTISDVDSANHTGATVSIGTGFATGQDVLAFTNQGGITGSYNGTTGVLTLSGTATLATYQTALRSVTYVNTSNNPSTVTRTVTFTANDGGAANNLGSASRSIAITAVNDAPVVTATAAALAYIENQGARAVDSGLTVTDVDSTNLTGATISIGAGFFAAEDVLAFTNQGGITGTYNATTGVLTLSGSATVATYQTALRSVTYANTSENPSTATRTVTFTVNDGSATNNTASAARNITVTAVNDAPVVTATATALAYTENQAATAVDPNLTVTDVDGTTLTGATVSISTGFATGQDVLAFTAQGGITGSYNATTGVLTLSGTATLATYQTALRTVTYANTSDNPTTTTRTVTFAANDGGAANNIGSGSRNIAITAVNDAPVVTATATALAYTENQAATAIDTGLTTADVDSTNLTGATVSIGAGFATGQDVLAFTTQGGITGSYNATTGVLTLSGTATLATYQTALRTVTYVNTSDNPSTVTRTVTFTANDGGAANNLGSASRNIAITAVNDAPVVTATAAALVYTENQAATSVDPGLTVTDVDSTNLTGATVSIGTGFATGQDVLAFTNQGGITGTYNATTGVLTLSGTATVATYQTALRSVTYANTSDTPSTATRTVTFTVNDGSAANNTASASRNITVTAVNDAPVVTATAAALAYTENQAATAIDNGLTVSDVDSTNLTGATVSIGAGFATGQDVLAFTTQGGITGSYNATTGVLTLSGTATLATYQTALRTVTYANTSDNPTTTTRTVTFAANDGSASNNTASAARTITVVAVNDAPTITSNGAGTTDTVSIAENTTAITTVTATDPENTTLTYAIVNTGDGGQFTIDASTGALRFTNAPDFENPLDADLNNSYVVTVQVSDGSLTDTQTITVNVTDVASTLIVDTLSEHL